MIAIVLATIVLYHGADDFVAGDKIPSRMIQPMKHVHPHDQLRSVGDRTES